MSRTGLRQGLRMLKLRDVPSRWEGSTLSPLEAGELPGTSERTFRRWTRRFEDEGDEGPQDRRLGRASGPAVPEGCCAEVERLYRLRYSGLTAKHVHEHLVRDLRFSWSYAWTKAYLQGRGLLAPCAAVRGQPAQAAAPPADGGMMLHQVAARHAWMAGRRHWIWW